MSGFVVKARSSQRARHLNQTDGQGTGGARYTQHKSNFQLNSTQEQLATLNLSINHSSRHTHKFQRNWQLQRPSLSVTCSLRESLVLLSPSIAICNLLVFISSFLYFHALCHLLSFEAWPVYPFHSRTQNSQFSANTYTHTHAHTHSPTHSFDPPRSNHPISQCRKNLTQIAFSSFPLKIKPLKENTREARSFNSREFFNFMNFDPRGSDVRTFEVRKKVQNFFTNNPLIVTC